MGDTSLKARWLIQGTIWSLAALVLIRAAGLARSVILARTLGPSTFGSYSIVISFLFTAMVLSAFGLPKACAKFIAEKGGDRKAQGEVLSAVWLISLLISAAIGLAVFVLSDAFASGIYREPSLSLPLALVGIILGLLTLYEVGLSTLQGFKEVRVRAAIVTIGGIVSVFVVGLLAYLKGLNGAMNGWLIASAVSLGLVIVAIARQMSKAQVRLARPSTAMVRMILGFSLLAFLAGSLAIPVYLYGDTLLARSDGFVVVGWMGVARSVGQLALLIPTAVAIPLLPMISENSLNRVKGTFSRIFRVNWFLALWISVLVGSSAKWLVPMLYGEPYAAASLVVYIYCIAAFLMAVASIYSSLLIGTGRIRQGFLLNSLWAFVFVVLSTFAIPRWGVNGLAATYVISYLLFALALAAYAEKGFHIVIDAPGRLVLTSLVLILGGYVTLTRSDDGLYLGALFLLIILGGAGSWLIVFPSDSRLELKLLVMALFRNNSPGKL